jgi:hypothetical protein
MGRKLIHPQVLSAKYPGADFFCGLTTPHTA